MVLEVDDFLDAVRRVGRGGTAVDPEVVARLVGRRGPDDPLLELTEREREVLALMAEGRSNSAIARKLFVSPKTVEANVRRIFDQLRLSRHPTTTGVCSQCSRISGAADVTRVSRLEHSTEPVNTVAADTIYTAPASPICTAPFFPDDPAAVVTRQ